MALDLVWFEPFAFSCFTFSTFSFSFLISMAFCFFSATALAFAFFLPSTLKSRSPSEASNSFFSSVSDSLAFPSSSSISSASSSDRQRMSYVYPASSLYSSSSSERSPQVLLSWSSNSSSAHLPSSIALDICFELKAVDRLFLVIFPAAEAIFTSSSGSKLSIISLSFTQINS